jgi:hypothetical protein
MHATGRCRHRTWRGAVPGAGLGPLLWALPLLAQAQSSPFLTGATALQTNILAWLTPIAVILVMVLGAMAMANRVRSELAERLRQEYRERVQQRVARSLSDNGPGPVREQPVSVTTPPAPSQRPSGKPWDIEEIRRQAREAWLLFRAREAAKNADLSRGSAQGGARDPSEDRETRAQDEVPRKDDLAL